MSSGTRGVNGLVGGLLRSSFSGLLDRSVALLTVRGRRTGRRYTLPVQYAQAGSAVWVLPAGHEGKTWWRNLLAEAPVEVRLRGRDLTGVARAYRGATEPALVEEGLRVYATRFGGTARRLGFGGRRGAIDEAGVREVAKQSVLVRILLDQSAELAGPAITDAALDQGRGVVAAVRRHPLAAFYVLAFALSWGYWIPDALAGGHVSHYPGLLGPALAAITVTGLTRGRAGLRELAARMTRWRVPLGWYAAAVAPLLVAVAAAAILGLAGGGFPGWAAFGRIPGLPDVGLVGVAALTLLINSFGEETGWRGFALLRFRRWHPRLQASVLDE